MKKTKKEENTDTKEQTDNNSNNEEIKQQEKPKTKTVYYCNSGWKLVGTTCQKTETINATTTEVCPQGTVDADCKRLVNAKLECGIPNSTLIGEYCYADPQPYAEVDCAPQGMHFANGVCYGHKDSTPVDGMCEPGYTPYGHQPTRKCFKTEPKQNAYTCPSGYNLNGTTCSKTLTTNAKTK